MAQTLDHNNSITTVVPVEIPLFEDDLVIIQKLDDEPNDVGGLTAAELKAEFDKGNLTAQKYINETLIPRILADDLTEQARQAAESERVSNEIERVANENARIEAESARSAAEAGRTTAEEGRVKAEQARVTAESGRVQAEQERAAAEAARVQAEQARVDTNNGIVARATAQANAATGSAASAAASAQNAAASEEGAKSAQSAAEAAKADATVAKADAQAAKIAAEAARDEAKGPAATVVKTHNENKEAHPYLLDQIGTCVTAAQNAQKAVGSHTHDDRYLQLTGGTLTGNLTGKYITGTWLQATSVEDLSRAAGKVAVLDDSGWVYYRTVAELLADLGIPDATTIRATSSVYGTTMLSTSVTSTSKSLAATPYAVKTALDQAKSYTDSAIGSAIGASY